MLTTIALAKVHSRILEDNMQDRIQCTSTIYDSIYYNCKADAETVKWLNDELSKAMSVDFLTDQRIKNEASLELGNNWSELTEIPNGCSLEHIESVISKLKEQ